MATWVLMAALALQVGATEEIDHGVAGRGPLRPVTVNAELSVRPPGSIERLRRFEAQTIVPGHGRVGGPELLDHTIAVIAATVEAANNK